MMILEREREGGGDTEREVGSKRKHYVKNSKGEGFIEKQSVEVESVYF